MKTKRSKPTETGKPMGSGARKLGPTGGSGPRLQSLRPLETGYPNGFWRRRSTRQSDVYRRAAGEKEDLNGVALCQNL